MSTLPESKKLTIYSDDPDGLTFGIRAFRAALQRDDLDSKLYGYEYGEGEQAWKVSLRVNKAGCTAWVYR